MPFRNPVVGGITLVRNAIQSENYNPGVSGWTINRDGTAEFTALVIDGGALTQFTITFSDNSQIHAYAGSYTQQITPGFPQSLNGTWIALRPLSVVGKSWSPGAIGTGYSSGVDEKGSVRIWSPYDLNNANDIQSEIVLSDRGVAGGGQQSTISLFAEDVEIGSPVVGGSPISAIANQITLREDVTITGDLSLTNGVNPGNLHITGTSALDDTVTFNNGVRGLPSCGLVATANYATNAAWQTISYGVGTEEWDTANMHDTAVNPSRITTPNFQAIWEITHYVQFPTNTTNQRGSCVLIGGTRYFQDTPTPAAAFSTTPGFTFKKLLPASTVIEHQLFQNSGVTLNSVLSNFQVSLYERL